MTDIVRVTDLGVRLGTAGLELVRDVSFALAAGGKLGIIGESGSGKSLTAMAVCGLLPDSMTLRGRIELEGRVLVDHPVHAPAPLAAWKGVRGRRLAVVFQEPLTALDPLMHVEQQLAGPLRLHQGLRGSAARAVSLDLLERVRIQQPKRILTSFPHELSGGQRQRVAIALALACKPEVLIADEPTTALDVTVQASIVALLRELVDEDAMSLIFITHDLPLIAGIVDDLVVMRRGSVVESGPTAAVVSSPQEPYTRELMAAAVKVSRIPYRDDEEDGRG